MSQSASIDPAKIGINIGNTQKITVTVTWDAGDTALTANDTYSFAKASGSGDVMIVDPSGGQFPQTVNFVPDPGGGNSATASITVQGNTRGIVNITGTYPKTPGSLATQCMVNVFPSSAFIRFKDGSNFSNMAMQVTGNTYDLATAPPEAKSTVTFEVMDYDDPTVSVGPLYPVTIYFYNVRETPNLIAGKFYINDTSFVLKKGTYGPNGASVQAVTDDKGQVTVVVIANANSGYIECAAKGGRKQTDSAYIYLFDSTTPPNPELDAPRYRGPKDITGDQFPTVPVVIYCPAAPQDEFVGLFLNNKFESQTDGQKFADGNIVTVDAQTTDVIVTKDFADINTYNNLFYCVTSRGDLHYSIAQLFPVTGTPPIAIPGNQILSDLIQPSGGVINLGSLTDSRGNELPFAAIMNVQADVAILKDKMNLTLTTAQKLRITVVAQGDYIKTDEFQVDQNAFDTDITTAMLTDPAVSIIIPREYLYGYGRPKDSSKSAKYTIWYGYVNATTDKDTFAASPVVSGALSTRPL